MTTAQTTLNKIQKGFTLIELLIVIAILGVLAAAVLSAINPVEQINRGRDTGSLSDAEQFLSAVSRFNAAQGYLPWMNGENDTQAIAWTPVCGTATYTPTVECGTALQNTATPAKYVLDLLGPNDPTDNTSVGTGELLPAYLNRVNSNTSRRLYVYNQGTGGGSSSSGGSTYVCYKPQSGSITVKAKDRCTNSKPGDYPAEACDFNSSGEYYYCLP